MADECRLIWNIAGYEYSWSTKQHIRKCKHWELWVCSWEGQGFLTHGGNEAERPDGVAWTELECWAQEIMLWRTFNQACHIRDDSKYWL